MGLAAAMDLPADPSHCSAKSFQVVRTRKNTMLR